MAGSWASGKVMVRGMDFGTTDDQLASHMSSAGAVQQVKWIDKGTAEVIYGSADEASYACQSLNQSTIPGNSRYIDVLPHRAGQSNWSQKRPAAAPAAPESMVFVRGFDFGTPQEQFESHMGSVGTVTNVNMVCKGSAEVTYSNAAEASAAIQQLNNTTIPGNTRYIDVMSPSAGQSNWPQAKRPAAAPDSIVFVRGFDFGTTREQMESHMGSAGTVADVHFLDKGSAEVTYGSADEASYACQSLNQSTIPGNSRYIEVKKQEGGPSPAKRWKTGGADNSMMEGVMQMLMQAMGGSSGAWPSKPSWNNSSSWQSSNFDPEKQQLIANVKTFQKSSEENKQMWYSFCETQPGGKYDPAKYEPDVLKMFLGSVGAM